MPRQPDFHADGSLPSDRLVQLKLDVAAHNAEVKSMWEAYRAKRPYRIPIILGVNSRYFMFNDRGANPDGLEFRAFTEDPDVMFDAVLRFDRWMRFNLLQDAELGLPEKWTPIPNFQNYYEAAWFGCQVHYFDGQVPDTLPEFADCPERIMEHGLPDPFGGHYAKVKRYIEHFRERAAGMTFLGRPVECGTPWCTVGTDGPMTVACNLFGCEFVCGAMLEEPQRLHKLLSFITDSTIARIRAWRKFWGHPELASDWGIADDSVALISTDAYRQHVMPHHRRLFEALSVPDKPRGTHLCGDSTRHFVTLRDELNIKSFDTGFPVDHAKIRRELGTDCYIQGGLHIDLLLTATPEQVAAETGRILTTGVLDGGLFTLREGNNLAPYTPLENTEAMYRVGREIGTFKAA